MNSFASLIEFQHDALNHETRQQWVQLLHMGNHQGRDGRLHPVSSFANILESFKREGIDLVVDYEQETVQENPVAAPAAGWIKQLEDRGEGLYGLIEWTERAFAMVRDKEYRYISPVYIVKPATFNLREELQKAREAALKGEEAISRNNVQLIQNAYEQQNFEQAFERVFEEGAGAGILLPFTKAYHYSACRVMNSTDLLEQHIKLAPA